MTNKPLTICILLCSILASGCCKEKIDITKIEISTQADVDYICDNLPSGDTFDGNVAIFTEEVLDYKCLNQIRHIKGSLIIEGPMASVPFKGVESVLGDDGIIVCDGAVDTISFPSLKIVATRIGFDSGCDFDNVLYVPNIESLSSITVASQQFPTTKRSGVISGFNLLEEMNSFFIRGGRDESSNVSFDGFYNLEKIKFQFDYSFFSNSVIISDNSFGKLQEVDRFILRQLPNKETHTDYRIEDLFPKLHTVNKLTIENFPSEDACYLLDHYLQGSIQSFGFWESTPGLSLTDQELIDLCE